tara:strand:- start:317 stop:1882 length:1566 start_codon:yes stop_codon:yes gene_type:complete
MLFNSPEFLFVYLPITLWLFFFFSKTFGNEVAIASLVVCSLFFYGWWNPWYLLLLAFSIGFNFWLGKRLAEAPDKYVLGVGIAVNLALLGYFKYAGFIVTNLSVLLENDWSLSAIILPLAISFFTFQQIAYLVDSFRGITREYRFIHYALFVSFFPQLIAGPIVHHKDMLPQFLSRERFHFEGTNLAIGLSIFAIGLFKKTVLADGVSEYANPVFRAADAGEALDFFKAWGGALAYTLQLYFDFSGYSDMAIGLARMFGIVLPLNFYSPYKASSIDEFWRRWHITLSNFLRDYLYIPLGGNRRGRIRRYVNLLTTMILGGIWHGAGWNFLIWGGLQGSYLVINQVWRGWIARTGLAGRGGLSYLVCSWVLTMFCVVVGWVFFRATTLDGALNVLRGMFGFNGATVPNGILVRLGEFGEVMLSLGIVPVHGGGSVFLDTWLWVSILFVIAVSLPNVQDIFNRVTCSLTDRELNAARLISPLAWLAIRLRWQNTFGWAVVNGVLLALALLTFFQVSEFLYFQF